MGQYYLVINTAKKQYLHPHHFGDGLKLLEFGVSGQGTMLGLEIEIRPGVLVRLDTHAGYLQVRVDSQILILPVAANAVAIGSLAQGVTP